MCLKRGAVPRSLFEAMRVNEWLLLYVAFAATVILFVLTTSSGSREKQVTERSALPLPAHPTASRPEKAAAAIPVAPARASPQTVNRNDAPQIEVFPEVCVKQLFLGNGGGGAGWHICGDALPESAQCVIYSFGLGADWSFDTAASGSPYSCSVHGFDPSDQNWQQGMHGAEYSNIHYKSQYPGKNRYFNNWGLSSAPRAVYPKHAVPFEWPGLGDPALSKVNSEAWDMRSVQQSMKDLGHRTLSVLKIDVEGGEWTALDGLFANNSKELSRGSIGQLLVEYHWDPDSTLRNERNARILDEAKKLGFVPWRVNRHKGSDCCLDVSYVWRSPRA